MRTALMQFDGQTWESHPDFCVPDIRPQLIICFGARQYLNDPALIPGLQRKHPSAIIVACSAAGEIFHTRLLPDGVMATAIEFSHTRVQPVQVKIADYPNSFEAGKALMAAISQQDLRYLMVFADGIHTNGSELAAGIAANNPQRVLVSGGLAGDGIEFSSTLVGMNEDVVSGQLLALAFYSDRLQVNHGCFGGWESFGLERVVTKSSGNVLYELDHKNPLELYRKYLGPDAAQLPATALYYPLSIESTEGGKAVVRSVTSINDSTGAMTFAGDIPEGAVVRFMKANVDRLTAAAATAAGLSSAGMSQIDLAFLISCVGRKLVLKDRTEEELEVVQEILGERVPLFGFYSYGELGPADANGACTLHNQTMTITTFHEAE